MCCCASFSDTRSLFLGMFIAILSVEIYCWLEGRKGLKIKMPDTVPPNVSRRSPP